jgi:hypothetical protein
MVSCKEERQMWRDTARQVEESLLCPDIRIGKEKVKPSRYRPGVAQRVPGS